MLEVSTSFPKSPGTLQVLTALFKEALEPNISAVLEKAAERSEAQPKRAASAADERPDARTTTTRFGRESRVVQVQTEPVIEYDDDDDELPDRPRSKRKSLGPSEYIDQGSSDEDEEQDNSEYHGGGDDDSDDNDDGDDAFELVHGEGTRGDAGRNKI
jgi:hypothetical protein